MGSNALSYWVWDAKTGTKHRLLTAPEGFPLPETGYFVDEDHLFLRSGGIGLYMRYDGSGAQGVRDADFIPALYSGTWRTVIADTVALQNIADGTVTELDPAIEIPPTITSAALYTGPGGRYAALELDGRYYVLDTAKGRSARLDPERYGIPPDGALPFAWLDGGTLAFNGSMDEGATVNPAIIDVKKMF